jgi:hypothetical protein
MSPITHYPTKSMLALTKSMLALMNITMCLNNRKRKQMINPVKSCEVTRVTFFQGNTERSPSVLVAVSALPSPHGSRTARTKGLAAIPGKSGVGQLTSLTRGEG